MTGDWFRVYYQKRRHDLHEKVGFVRFALDRPPFVPDMIQRGQIRYDWQGRLPWQFKLPGCRAEAQIFDGPIAYAEWYAAEICKLAGITQTYKQVGSVWYVLISDGQLGMVLEVWIEEVQECYRYNAVEVVE